MREEGMEGSQWIQPLRSCLSVSYPCAALFPVNMPRAGPCSGACSLAAVKEGAREKIHECAGKEMEGRGSPLGELGSAGDDALWV